MQNIIIRKIVNVNYTTCIQGFGRFGNHCGEYAYTEIQLSTTLHTIFTSHAKRGILLIGEYFVGAGSRIPRLAMLHCIPKHQIQEEYNSLLSVTNSCTEVKAIDIHSTFC